MFVVLHATAIDQHLHGYISRYLHQINATLYVGTLSTRVADELQQRLLDNFTDGTTTLLRSDPKAETGYRITLHRTDQRRRLVEFDDLQIVVRDD